MEYLINFLSNDMADKLVVNSKNNLNSLSIIIPFEYAKNKVSINWNDMLFLVTNGYFNKESVVKYAIDVIEISDDKRIIDLACFEEFDLIDESFLTTISELADELPEKTKKVTKIKALYLLLSFLYDNRCCIESPERILDIVFDDFGFPLILQEFMNTLHKIDKTQKYKEQVYNLWLDLLSYLKTIILTKV